MNAWNFYTAKELKPCGWMRRQLEIQAEGLAGNLDRVWPDVRDSAWIGGEREGWERVPYWLDGFVPLAYLLDDEGMKARAKKYIDAILSRQKENGWIVWSYNRGYQDKGKRLDLPLCGGGYPGLRYLGGTADRQGLGELLRMLGG